MKMLACAMLPVVMMLAPVSEAWGGVLADHRGYWMGDLRLPDGQTFKTGLEIFTRADGSTWASFASPDQDSFDIPVRSITETGSTADIVLSFGEMNITWSGQRFQGNWTQAGKSFPLELSQVADFPRKVRPQAPVAPFPYTSEELSIPSTDGVTLGATLSVPKGIARPNLVVLVAGSGPMTRDEQVAGHRLFAVMADYLLRQGVAVIRYDKRGVSRSTGDYENHTEQQLQDDLAAVLASMKARRQFNRVGVIGHSEGPMIAAAVAGRQPELVDFLVSMAGVGLPGLDMMLLQDRLAAKDQGATRDELDRLENYGRHFYGIVIAEEDAERRVAALKAFIGGLSAADAQLIKKYGMQSGSLSLAEAARPVLREVLLADPRKDWRKVKCSVLAMNGSLDHQVPPESLFGIRTSLTEGGNRKVETMIIPSLNHLFQTAKTGSEDEYGTIEETIAPIALQTIAKFVRQAGVRRASPLG